MIKKLFAKPFAQFFLLDGIGALVTASLLVFLLGNLEPVFGMPKKVLHFLAGIASAFSIYSFSCYFFVKKHWQPFLRGIAIANSLYCLLTFSLVIYYWLDPLKPLGMAYFIGEIGVVMSLVFLEFKKAETYSKDE